MQREIVVVLADSRCRPPRTAPAGRAAAAGPAAARLASDVTSRCASPAPVAARSAATSSREAAVGVFELRLQLSIWLDRLSARPACRPRRLSKRLGLLLQRRLQLGDLLLARPLRLDLQHLALQVGDLRAQCVDVGGGDAARGRRRGAGERQPAELAAQGRKHRFTSSADVRAAGDDEVGAAVLAPAALVAGRCRTGAPRRS